MTSDKPVTTIDNQVLVEAPIATNTGIATQKKLLTSQTDMATPTYTTPSPTIPATATNLQPAPVNQETQTPTPAPITVSVTMSIERCGDDHCIGIINLGGVSLPLSNLVIKIKDFSISGSDWGILELSPGDCLVATSNSNKWLPTQGACSSATSILTVSEDFKKKELEVIFNDVSYGKCKKEQKSCQFTVTYISYPD